MANFDGNDLKKWRISQGLSVPDLADAVGESVETIRRYEANANKFPHPDVMYQMCLTLGDPRKWHTWMRTEFKSYAREHPEPIMYDLPGAIMTLYAEVRDLEDLERQAMKDGASGEINNRALREKLLREIEELISAAQAAKALIKGGKRDG